MINLPVIDSKEVFSKKINDKLCTEGVDIVQAIKERDLYFRMSVIGACNLSCSFCHNEGVPTKGIMDLNYAISLFKIARNTGFERIQFTGGEPLLHKNIEGFVYEAKQFFPNVGITTNGSFLLSKIDKLLYAGIDRIHISLQDEELRTNKQSSEWRVPKWLKTILEIATESKFDLRLNLPIPVENIFAAKDFLREIAKYKCNIKAFTVLPEGKEKGKIYPLDLLVSLIEEENNQRIKEKNNNFVFIRSFKESTGLRCEFCTSKPNCQEQSRSLRVGADKVLRPCLATREWDIKIQDSNLESQFLLATYLALDYI